MMGGRRCLVVVPARGGSKGIPRKNLRTIGGRSLVALTGDVVRDLDWVDRAVVSTDDAEIVAEAEHAGLAAPFRRPSELSGDRIGDLDVLLHALLTTEACDGRQYDVVVMLQPTCPLRLPRHVAATVEKLITEGLDAVWTVSPSDPKLHPLKQLVVDSSGLMRYYDPAGAAIVARQQLAPLFHRNGAAYAFARSCLVEQHAIMGGRSGAIIVTDPLVNIDTEEDLAAAERLLGGSGPEAP